MVDESQPLKSKAKEDSDLSPQLAYPREVKASKDDVRSEVVNRLVRVVAGFQGVERILVEQGKSFRWFGSCRLK